MGLIEITNLKGLICPPLDQVLTEQLIAEFVSIERRYVLRDWEPAELDGGQFSEILARIIYHLDSGNLNLTKGFDECTKYVLEDNNHHQIKPRHDAIHLVMVLKTIYKFRSQRGAVHISPNYAANQMDSRLIIENVRWAFSETLRIFWTGNRDLVAKTIRELLDFDVPCIGKFDNVILVQRTDLTAEQEILVLLHYAGENGFTRQELGKHAARPASSITLALQKLCSPSKRLVILMPNGRHRLTDLGCKFLREKLADKLVLE